MLYVIGADELNTPASWNEDVRRTGLLGNVELAV